MDAFHRKAMATTYRRMQQLMFVHVKACNKDQGNVPGIHNPMRRPSAQQNMRLLPNPIPRLAQKDT
jgi:hypothetical protein